MIVLVRGREREEDRIEPQHLLENAADRNGGAHAHPDRAYLGDFGEHRLGEREPQMVGRHGVRRGAAGLDFDVHGDARD